MPTKRARILIATIAAVMCCGTFAAIASATIFVHHVEIYAGNHVAGVPYTSNVVVVSVGSYGSAFSGTWINDSTGSGGTRISVDNYCNTPGCVVQITWVGSKPSGYGTAENHGNASPSYFEGDIAN